MKILSEYKLGDMLLRYLTDEERHVGMMLIPAEMADCVLDKQWKLEPLAQYHTLYDVAPGSFAGGHSLACSDVVDEMRLVGQERRDDAVITTIADAAGRTIYHRAAWHAGLEALRVSTAFENNTGEPLTLDLLTSVNVGNITPFTPADAVGALTVHRVHSAWSAEGRLHSESVESMHLESSWSGYGMRIEKFAQIGSMPVRGWFPFAAVEDKKAGVTWAIQLACPSSWQCELRRQGEGLSMSIGLPDDETGRWRRTVNPGERFETPEAYVTAGRCGVDAASQRLLTVQRENWLRRDEELPVLFNEYCTTWGNPTHENMVKIANRIRGHEIDFMVMDAGWYGRGNLEWSECGGDWIPNAEMFPDGLKATADAIRACGFKPGIWFEAENCAPMSELFGRDELLLKKRGHVLGSAKRRFLDMRMTKAHEYLAERVTGLLQKCGFEYIKVDYNDTIGIGCDDPDGLGEGLRNNMQGTLDFFREMRAAVPGLYIENCSSGGHRLEPSMMGVADMASFSDAHECQEIPIIAANLHRMILPGQSQIWAVLRKTDSLRRVNYSLVNTFLGVMCLSGDMLDLSDEQWKKVDEGIAFYKAVRHIIRDGVTSFHGDVSESWRHPTGWQGIVRTSGGETLAVIHTFGGSFPASVTLPVSARRVRRIMCSENNDVYLGDGCLTVSLNAPFEAIAVYLD